ncbi:hypothetical protein ACIRF8_21015 [Streptomyces sp. NPDC102406]|uniref:hypothetical protein n=1 Tax=Streptomyces sp. NPDC102406 TaxID=3366171 RepID=UPI003803E47D
MSEELIDPSGIPHFIGDLATLDTDVTNLGTHAGEFRTAGSDVHTEFQGLSAFYKAPEADQLFATTLPVQTKTDAFADDLEQVATALSTYSTEVQPLVKKLETLKADATAFVASVAGDDDWRKDQDKVDHNNDLWHDVNHTVTAFQDAERTAYNKIMALIGGTPLTADDGSHGGNMYGYKAGDLDHAEGTPWGSSAEREYEGLAWLGHQIKSFVWDGFIVDGVWGTIKGLGTLVGTDGWAQAGEAWENLGKLGTAVVLSSATMGTWWLVPDDKLPSWLRDSRTVYKQTAKSLVAWDTWKTNPARAAGQVAFNGLTAVFTGGSGSVASGAGKAGAVARTLSVTGKVARVVDPMTYVGKAGKLAFVKVGDTFTALKNLHTGTTLDLLRQADAIKSPTIPATAIPYVDNATGKVVYLTDEGHILNADGSLHQHGTTAKVEASAADRARIDAADRGARSPQLVGAHPAVNSAADAGHAATGDAQAVGRSGTPLDNGGSDGTSSTATGRQAPGTGSAGDGSHGDQVPHQGRAGHGDGPERQRTPEEQRAVTEEQVKKANEDPVWRLEHYYEDGRRRSIYGKDENGDYLPQLKERPGGGWIAADDAPMGPPERYRLGTVKLDPASVAPVYRGDLDDIARLHHAHSELNSAEKAFDTNPGPDTAHALHEAKKAFGEHPRNSRIGEELGEKSAALHAVPEIFPEAKLIELPKTPTGAHQFDQLYRLDHDQGLLIVEAKAPDGKLGWRWGEATDAGRKVKQGTVEYVKTIAELMEARGGKEAEIAAEIKRALRRKQGLQYILVQTAHHTGTYPGADVKYFKIF